MIALKDRLKILAAFKNTLFEASSCRKDKNEFINGELAWVTHERNIMLKEVNSLLHDPVDIEDIKRCENSAIGHCDYISKFALYCVFLVEERQNCEE